MRTDFGGWFESSVGARREPAERADPCGVPGQERDPGDQQATALRQGLHQEQEPQGRPAHRGGARQGTPQRIEDKYSTVLYSLFRICLLDSSYNWSCGDIIKLHFSQSTLIPHRRA